MFSDVLTFLHSRQGWYHLPEVVCAVFFLVTAFFALLLAGIEHHLRRK